MPKVAIYADYCQTYMAYATKNNSQYCKTVQIPAPEWKEYRQVEMLFYEWQNRLKALEEGKLDESKPPRKAKAKAR